MPGRNYVSKTNATQLSSMCVYMYVLTHVQTYTERDIRQNQACVKGNGAASDHSTFFYTIPQATKLIHI